MTRRSLFGMITALFANRKRIVGEIPFRPHPAQIKQMSDGQAMQLATMKDEPPITIRRIVDPMTFEWTGLVFEETMTREELKQRYPDAMASLSSPPPEQVQD